MFVSFVSVVDEEEEEEEEEERLMGNGVGSGVVVVVVVFVGCVGCDVSGSMFSCWRGCEVLCC